jgi:hypothetical protein
VIVDLLGLLSGGETETTWSHESEPFTQSGDVYIVDGSRFEVIADHEDVGCSDTMQGDAGNRAHAMEGTRWDTKSMEPQRQ